MNSFFFPWKVIFHNIWDLFCGLKQKQVGIDLRSAAVSGLLICFTLGSPFVKFNTKHEVF